MNELDYASPRTPTNPPWGWRVWFALWAYPKLCLADRLGRLWWALLRAAGLVAEQPAGDFIEVLGLAEKTALEMGHARIAPEHLLRGIVQVGARQGGYLLALLGVDLAELDTALVKMLESYDKPSLPRRRRVRRSDEAKAVIAQARREAVRAGHGWVGTSHLLVSLAAIDGLWTQQVLAGFGVTAERLRARLMQFEREHVALQKVFRLLKERRYYEAIAECREELAADPGSVEAQGTLAWLLATAPDEGLRDGAAALELAQRVCAGSRYRLWVDLEIMAVAHAELGRFEEAQAWAEKALALTPASDKTRREATLEVLRRRQPLRAVG